MAEQMTKKIGKKVLEGKVVSDKMQKTITVQVSRRTLHPVYQKYLTMSKKYKAHDEQETAKVGDTVRIQECRPISKDKVWTLLDVVERAK
jgi:small subunit ribosomal protein S17